MGNLRVSPQDELGSQALTPTQLAVLELVGCGLTTKGIAARLALSPATVETHVREAMKRLGARTRLQATACAPPVIDVTTRRASVLLLEADEQRLLGLLATGATMRQAADFLHVSRRTCTRRLAAARTKLGTVTTAEAVLRAAHEQGRTLLVAVLVGMHVAANALDLVDGPLELVNALPF